MAPLDQLICIHGHFYQPPRENPWLEEVEAQPSAHPYHDWNERITAECYGPLAALGLYAKISFDFGPTLLSWLERKAPAVYESIRRSDQESRGNFSGHGSAMAQAYNHIILPLANHRDRVTQVAWGIRDFEFRFGRRPEGMWLPETAVDLETLEILAERGILFTVLAPHQAGRVRPLSSGSWHSVSGERIDPSQAYLLRLPSGRKIHLFFYQGTLSRAVAFEKLVTQGEIFAKKLLGAFSGKAAGPQLVHIASDGETYGHHFPGGDQGLAEAIRRIEAGGPARLTNYGEHLERHPATHEVEIVEKSSWSCTHGVDRWWSDCGCNAGAPADWNQSWRTPLRDALDWLRDSVAPRFEQAAAGIFKDPWAARDRSIELILERSPEGAQRFLEEQAARPLEKMERDRALKLLELQRQALLMYTSCGWFFNDISGIEAVQILQYAARAIQLAEELFGDPLESEFLKILMQARSNRPECGDGRQVYEASVMIR